jgi:uncharacterized CHY-type Zn-finger protein
MKLICGKCNTEQDMTRRHITDKIYTLWCPNCKDQISPGCCRAKGL